MSKVINFNKPPEELYKMDAVVVYRDEYVALVRTTFEIAGNVLINHAVIDCHES
jgi:hypothetical protein